MGGFPINQDEVCTFTYPIQSKEVNIVPEAVLIWPVVRYISDTSQYRYTISGLPLFYVINIYIHTPTQPWKCPSFKFKF